MSLYDAYINKIEVDSPMNPQSCDKAFESIRELLTSLVDHEDKREMSRLMGIWLQEIDQGYKGCFNFYHSIYHSFEVFYSTSSLLNQNVTMGQYKLEFTNLMKFLILMIALIHDVQHYKICLLRGIGNATKRCTDRNVQGSCFIEVGHILGFKCSKILPQILDQVLDFKQNNSNPVLMRYRSENEYTEITLNDSMDLIKNYYGEESSLLDATSRVKHVEDSSIITQKTYSLMSIFILCTAINFYQINVGLYKKHIISSVTLNDEYKIEKISMGLKEKALLGFLHLQSSLVLSDLSNIIISRIEDPRFTDSLTEWSARLYYEIIGYSYIQDCHNIYFGCGENSNEKRYLEHQLRHYYHIINRDVPSTPYVDEAGYMDTKYTYVLIPVGERVVTRPQDNGHGVKERRIILASCKLYHGKELEIPILTFDKEEESGGDKYEYYIYYGTENQRDEGEKILYIYSDEISEVQIVFYHEDPTQRSKQTYRIKDGWPILRKFIKNLEVIDTKDALCLSIHGRSNNDVDKSTKCQYECLIEKTSTDKKNMSTGRKLPSLKMIIPKLVRPGGSPCIKTIADMNFTMNNADNKAFQNRLNHDRKSFVTAVFEDPCDQSVVSTYFHSIRLDIYKPKYQSSKV